MATLNKNNSAVKRIMQEARELANDPSPEYSAAPLEDDIFEWHCTLRGPAGTEFEGGLYHFRILLPAEYPFRPPSLMMLTPNGRFETDTKICISFTSYHEELWQPAWGVRTAIIGLQGFFPLKGKAAVGIGSIEHPTTERKRLAALSRSWVCPHCRESNLDLLPDPVAPSSSTEPAAPAEPPAAAPVSAPSLPDTDSAVATPLAPSPVATPASAPIERVAAPIPRPRTQVISQPRQRPPILLDTAICVILVLVCGIVFRRMF
ncbi:ubiquitin-conjugating enzyme/RWD-like protein [Mycena metata]|uniref:Ubiquitin-conjugating enzyme/RWD-like protein n=1 Tax=Mycena metata TaxID=1033252 RepID=A0AAD7NAW6_9AGAR|nr:ubiquitin-conjugating enzyme/RWD-like protein [Mycena metata]